MTVPEGRNNGLLPAARYSALVDVDPPVADHVLELLRDAEISAIATPLTGRQGLARDTIAPDRPTERIHVDHDEIERAHAVVARALPSLRSEFHADAAMRSDAADMRALDRQREFNDSDVDELFNNIVSGFAETSSEPVPRWSVREDRDDSDSDVGHQRLIRDLPGPRDYELIEDDGHFVPPAPPPLPETDPITRLAWGALLGGPLLIVIATLFGLHLEPWMVLGALAAFLGGFTTLVARMRDRKSDGWDDGAVV
jgi:hypothetical protein